MELVPGRTLDEIVAAGRPFDVARIAGIGSDAARALAHAHERGVMHRDVSPANIMVTPDS